MTASIRRETLWALSGALAQTAHQAVVMGLLAHCGGPALVGQYALGLAIVTPLNIFADRAIRTLQATAGDDDYALGDYLGFRNTIGWMTFLVTVALCCTWDMSWSAAAVVFMLALIRQAEGLAQALYGRMHRCQRMWMIGQSQILRSLFGSLAFSAAMLTLRDLDLALGVLLLAHLLIIAGLDRRRVVRLMPDDSVASTAEERRVTVLFRGVPWRSISVLALPLSISTFFVALNRSIPRLFLARYSDEAMLGVFALLCYACVPTTMISSSIMQTVTPRLALLSRNDESLSLGNLIWKLYAISALLAGVSYVAAELLGPSILRTYFEASPAELMASLRWIVLAGGVGYFAIVPATTLCALRRFHASVVVCLMPCVVSVVGGLTLVPWLSMRGAAVTMLLANLAQFVTACVALAWDPTQTSSRSWQQNKNAQVVRRAA